MRSLFLALLLAFFGLQAQCDTVAQIATAHGADIAKPSRQTIGPVIADLAASGDPMAARLLEAWGN